MRSRPMISTEPRVLHLFPSNARWLSPGRLFKPERQLHFCKFTELISGNISPVDNVHSKENFFFSLGYGRCRTVARSLHEHKQSKRHLYKDPEGPEVQANHNKPKTTQTIKTTRTSPSQICVSSKQKTANQTHKGARAQTKTPTKRICQGTQRSYHCVTLKNMPKLIIHHDIQ